MQTPIDGAFVRDTHEVTGYSSRRIGKPTCGVKEIFHPAILIRCARKLYFYELVVGAHSPGKRLVQRPRRVAQVVNYFTRVTMIESSAPLIRVRECLPKLSREASTWLESRSLRCSRSFSETRMSPDLSSDRTSTRSALAARNAENLPKDLRTGSMSRVVVRRYSSMRSGRSLAPSIDPEERTPRSTPRTASSCMTRPHTCVGPVGAPGVGAGIGVYGNSRFTGQRKPGSTSPPSNSLPSPIACMSCSDR